MYMVFSLTLQILITIQHEIHSRLLPSIKMDSRKNWAYTYWSIWKQKEQLQPKPSYDNTYYQQDYLESQWLQITKLHQPRVKTDSRFVIKKNDKLCFDTIYPDKHSIYLFLEETWLHHCYMKLYEVVHREYVDLLATCTPNNLAHLHFVAHHHSSNFFKGKND